MISWPQHALAALGTGLRYSEVSAASSTPFDSAVTALHAIRAGNYNLPPSQPPASGLLSAAWALNQQHILRMHPQLLRLILSYEGSHPDMSDIRGTLTQQLPYFPFL